MGRPLKGTKPNTDPMLTADFWSHLMGKPDPTQREQFLWLTIHHVRSTGLAQFTISQVAKQLGYSVAMVNHHFGSRDGLIAECAEIVYERYTEALRVSIETAEQTPRARLTSFLRANLEWGKRLGGWSVVIHYPNFSFENPNIALTRTHDGFNEGLNSTLVTIAQLVIDLRAGTISNTVLEVAHFPQNVIDIDRDAILWAANIGFALTGMRAWLVGRHSIVSDDHTFAQQYDEIIRRELDLIVDVIPPRTP